jgi:hypothetical protein
MNRKDILNDPIKSLNLKNNVQVAFYDLSKTIAGDRWFVRVCCVAKLPLLDVFFEGLEEDKEIVNAMKEACDAELTMEIVKDRNFIDEQLKDDVVKQFILQIEENSIGYMSSDIFPQKLFLSKFEEFKKKHLLTKASEGNSASRDVLDEDDGPTDFSACFQD